MGVITEEARRWAEQDYPDYAFAVNERDIQKYAHAIGETDRIHFDREAAIEAGYDEIVAPPFFPYVIRMHASHLVGRDQLEPDGSASADVPPLNTTKAMAGEITIDLGEPVLAGDVVKVTKRITDLFEKEGRSGTLVFVKMEFTFTNQRGDLVAREEFTRIYR
jgi:hydroxyacyl-ACP dehydratase HTD2-like protein with hotdog domain